uniref:Uncharacterized protein n=1 Tax=Anguilla anguilla TaxID=7936 RepID=A0A0E9U8R0_ANGAN
MRPTGEMPSCL